MENLIMGIKNHRSINKAAIRINKINVVGGVNGSGKSTASRILYTFLKTYSSDRWEVAISKIIDIFNDIREELIKDGIEEESKLPKELKYDDDYFEVMDCFLKLKDIVENYLVHEKNKKEEFLHEISNVYDSLLEQLEEDFDKEFIIELQKFIQVTNDEFIDFMNETYKKHISSEHNYSRDISIYRKVIYTKDFISKKDINLNNYNKFFKKIDNLHKKTENLKSEFYDDQMFELKLEMSFLFSENDDLSRIHVMEELLDRESLIDNRKEKINFEFFIEISDSEYILAKDFFKDNGNINDVFYFDNVSIFDLKFKMFDECWSYDKKRNIEHIEHIFSRLSNSNIDDDSLNEKTLLILEKIDKIIGGKFNINNNIFFPYLDFVSENFHTDDKNVVSSGMKQIGIVQLLLLNNCLKEDTYLIIDEPEVNLHPDWQFKFAEILVLLAKELNVTVYLNSHSPFFIEAIDAFTEFYDMQEDINFYLTEESEVEGKYNFTKIDSDELYKIYDNLGRPYDLIDQLRLRKHLGEKNG